MAESASSAKGEWSKSVGAIAFLVLALLILVGIIVFFGSVKGEEFSPSNFSRRSFVFYRIPIVKIQVTPVVRASTTSALESYISSNHFGSKSAGNVRKSEDMEIIDYAQESEPDAGQEKDEARPKNDTDSKSDADSKNNELRWDVVELTPLTQATEKGSAICLCAYLDRKQDNDLKWLVWSKANPKLAAALWPEIRRVAIDKLYFAVPDMMEAAEEATTRKASAEQLTETLRAISNRAADIRSSAGGDTS